MSHLRSAPAAAAIPHRRAALGGLALGLAIAVAANLTYAVPRGPVVVGLGVIAPLVLPVVLYLRTTFVADGFWPRLLREAATLAVAGPAVAISYVHTFELIRLAGEPLALALLAPLSSDGLAGMATLALHRNRVRRQARSSAPSRAASRTSAPHGSRPPQVQISSPAAAGPQPVSPPETPPAAVGDELLERARALVAKGREGGRRYGRGQLAADLGCTADRARKLLAEIDADRPVKLVGA